MKKVWIVFIISSVILGATLFFGGDLIDFYSGLETTFPKIEKNVSQELAQIYERRVLTPPPLRSDVGQNQGFLTIDGVTEATNVEREKQQLPLLKESAELNASAKMKAEDMLKNQYFGHNSPSGAGVADLAQSSGYDFIIIGENLALGNFKDDKALAQAWMESPGHRANILNANYKEIGVSVIKGEFEGEEVWLAVQHFGLPLSSCPAPNVALKQDIELNQDKIYVFQQRLEALEAEIENTARRPRAYYSQKVEEYNILVTEYNELVVESRTLVSRYNSQVEIFNQCVSSKAES